MITGITLMGAMLDITRIICRNNNTNEASKGLPSSERADLADTRQPPPGGIVDME